MIKVPTLLACIGLPLALVAPAHAIVGGADSRDPSGPRRYTVAVVAGKAGVCSGAVIAPDVVLTAAHCLVAKGAYRVVALDRNFRPRLFAVAQFIRNPAFRPGVRPTQQTGLDIGLLRLAQPLPADMQPISVATDLDAIIGLDRASVAGFGVSAYGAAHTSLTLRQTTLRKVALGRAGAPVLVMSGDGSASGRGASACLGDSGGPVVAEGMFSTQLVGLVSWVGTQRGAGRCEGVTVATPVVLPASAARAVNNRSVGAPIVFDSAAGGSK